MEIAAGWADTLLVPMIAIVGLAVTAFILRARLRKNTPAKKTEFVNRDGAPATTIREQKDETHQNDGNRTYTHDQFMSLKSESLGLIAGGMAHDFNNLLTSILGNATLARMETELNSPLDVCLSEIETTSIQASELCRQLLLYSGKGNMNAIPLDLKNLVENINPIIQELAGPNISLQFDLAEGPHPVEADSEHIRTIIQSFVKNSVEAIGDEPGTICISVNSTSISPETDRIGLVPNELEPGDYSYFKISDTGHGMTPEVRGRAFDPFFTTKLACRGLGLSEVLGIIRSHKAGLKLESEPNNGTTFTVLLRRAAVSKKKVDPQDPSISSGRI